MDVPYRKRVELVVPTYNESGSIGDLVRAIEPVRESISGSYDLTLLVVDDSSPDGTGTLVEHLRETRPWITLLTRTQKAGLGAAYRHGLAAAVERQADIIFEMDADLSHDPAAIPAMLRRIEYGADFVIGSRYVNGGSVPEHWPTKRRVISWLSNAGARTVLGLDTNDCSGGYRAIERSVLERTLERIGATGYGFQIELLYRAKQAGAIIDEVPIQFSDRTSGESKMRFSDMREMAQLIFTLRFSRTEAVRS